MNNPLESEELDQVLESYVAENETLNRETLKEWTRRYPQFERELMDFTVTWIQMQALPPAKISKAEAEILVQRGISVVHKLLREEQDRLQQKPKVQRSIQGLIKEASRRKVSLTQLASYVNLTPAFLAKIDGRMIRYASIPLQFLESLANALDWDVLSIVKYLQGQPKVSQAMRFKSRSTPRVGQQKDFFEEIRNDPELSDEFRHYWLEFEHPK